MDRFTHPAAYLSLFDKPRDGLCWTDVSDNYHVWWYSQQPHQFLLQSVFAFLRSIWRNFWTTNLIVVDVYNNLKLHRLWILTHWHRKLDQNLGCDQSVCIIKEWVLSCGHRIQLVACQGCEIAFILPNSGNNSLRIQVPRTIIIGLFLG